MSILTLGSEKERRKISNQRESKKKERAEGKFPNQRVGESKKKRKKIPNQRMGESKKRKERKFLIKENRRNVQKGLLTRQYLNNTELSPNERKKKEREPQPKIVFSL